MDSTPLAAPLPRFTPAALAALDRAARALPPGRDRLTAADLVAAILAEDTSGARMVDVLAPGKVPALQAQLGAAAAAQPGGPDRFGELDLAGGYVLALDATSRALFDRLAALSGRTVGTKELLATEATVQGSALVEALAALGLGGPPESLASQLAALATRIRGEETSGSRTLVYRPIGTPPSADLIPDRRQPYGGPVDRSGSAADWSTGAGGASPSSGYGSGSEAWPTGAGGTPGSLEGGGGNAEDGDIGSGTIADGGATGTAPGLRPAPQPGALPGPATSGQPQPRSAPVAPVLDLLAQARADGSVEEALYVNPAWVKRILAAIERNSLTIVVADNSDSVDALVAALAEQLARDSTGVFNYRSVVTLEPGYLATQPAGALRDGVRAAQAGILYLPNIARYLDERRSAGGSQDLRRAIAQRTVRVIATLSDRDAKAWPPEDAPEHELLYLDPATIDEVIGFLKSRREAIVRSVSTPNLNLVLSDESIETAARLADRYFRDPPPPGGALRLIQEAATAIKVRTAQGMAAIQDERVMATPTIDGDDVRLALERITGIKAQLDDQQKLLNIEDFLRQRVIGQEEAIHAVADAIRRARAGLKDPGRPIGSFLFLGPSGVGKTELAKALAEFLFDDEAAMVRLDMSEYHESHTISRMIGAPPGYVGYDAGGQLTEPVRKRPYILVLFDEIEKSHPDVQNVLLQIMDDGRLTDSRGRTVDFRNTVIIMTGNVGSRYYMAEPELGREKVVAAVREEARDAFRPEFLGRIDEFLIFNSLGPEQMRQIVDIQERKLSRRLGEQGLKIRFTDGLKDFLAQAGYAPELGARPLNGHIRSLIERPLSRLIIEGRFKAGDTITADIGSDGQAVFSGEEAAEPVAPPPAEPVAPPPSDPSHA